MVYAGQFFRLFVSSTFSDFKWERDALQRRVFPHLRELCRQHGARFQAIDLRWGVSQEASNDQRTVSICVEEIRRCREVSPHVNFLILLGDHYGSRLLPEEIPASEFEMLHKHIALKDDLILRKWYKLDTNAVPPVYILLPRTDIYEKYEEWTEVEKQLQALLADACNNTSLSRPASLKYLTSITEQEIEEGVLRHDDVAQYALCYFRTIINGTQNGSVHDYLGSEREAQERLVDLKRRLTERLPASAIQHYKMQYDGNRPANDHLAAFCKAVYRSLAERITAALTIPEREESEAEAHDRFGQKRIHHFIGRKAPLRSIAEYLRSDARHPLVIYGPSGAGKTTLLAKAAQEARRAYPGAVIITRYIGVTPDTSNTRDFLNGLARQILDAYRPTRFLDGEELMQDFAIRLPEEVTATKPLILFIDALDQLRDHEHSLAWFPVDLPPFAHVIFSTLSDRATLSALSLHLPLKLIVELEVMTPEEGATLLDHWLREAGRTLQQAQRDEVLRKFAPYGQPLYLRLAFEEARRWHSFDPVQLLKRDIPGIVRDLFERLSRPANHGKVLVAHGLGYLTAAKNGLSEDEIVDVLSADAKVLEDVRRHSPNASPIDGRLPVVLWSRLFFDLEPYLTERRADGTTLITFYHRQLSEAVEAKYLPAMEKRQRHRGLAAYFSDQALVARKDGQTIPNLRKLAELPYQQTEGQLWDGLYTTLTDFHFLEAKATAVTETKRTGKTKWETGRSNVNLIGIYLLQEDFDRALKQWQKPRHNEMYFTADATPTSPPHHLQYLMLENFSRTLHRHGHLLVERPDLLWQVFYNDLQWERSLIPEAMAAEFESRSKPGTRPWLLLRNRLPESSILINTMANDGSPGGSCAITPDGSFIVSGGSSFLRVWDARTGQKRIFRSEGDLIMDFAVSPDGSFVVSAGFDNTLKVRDTLFWRVFTTLRGHTETVTSCAISPDSSFIISASDEILKIWDTHTWQERFTLPTHQGVITACAISPDGSFIVSAGGYERGNMEKYRKYRLDRYRKNTLKIWDTRTWQERFTLHGHKEMIMACAVSPDGSFIVSASEDFSLKVWNVRTGHSRTLYGHTDAVTSCAISPDGSFIVSGSSDETLKIWDTQTWRVRATLHGHTNQVAACAVSPEGFFIASTGYDSTIRIWDATTGEARTSPHNHTNVGTSHDDGSNESRLIFARPITIGPFEMGSMRLWFRKAPPSLRAHDDAVTACVASPDGAVFVSAGKDNKFKIWNAQSGEKLAELPGYGKGGRSCAFSPDSTFLITGDEKLYLKVWDTSIWRRRFTLLGHPASACAISPDSVYIVAGSRNGPFQIYDAKTKRKYGSLKPGNAKTKWREDTWGDERREIYMCAVSPDGSFIVSIDDGDTITVWDTRSGFPRGTIKDVLNTNACVISPDSAFIFSVNYSSDLTVWDSRTGNHLAVLREHIDEESNLLVSPDGTFIVATSHDHQLIVLDLETGQNRFLYSHAYSDAWLGDVFAISPNGKFIVTLRGSMLQVWDAQSNEECAAIRLQSKARCLALHPWYPLAFCGDEVGNVYFIELIGIPFDPLIVSAVDSGDGPTVRCPRCRHVFMPSPDHIGHEIICPQSACAIRLRINPFVVTMQMQGAIWTTTTAHP